MTLTLTGAGPSAASGGGAAFAPTDIAGLQAWYKADAGTSTTTDGVAISQWNDQSGNARHAVQATGANQPLYKAAILNGKPVVRFDGTNDQLTTAALTIAQPSTIFVVVKTTTPSATQGVVDGATSRQHIYLAGNAAWHYFAGTDIASTAAGDLLAHSFSAIFNGASSGFWQDGASISAANPGATALTSLIIGNNSVGNGPFAGDMGELLFYNSALSVANRQSVEAYLRTRWATP